MASTSALAVMIGALAFLVFCSVHIDATRVSNDVNKCGKQKRMCPPAPAHSDRTCKNGKCGFQCKGPWRDCDYSKNNGCEANVECDPRNCGRCGKKCRAPCPNSIATCKDWKCGFVCKPGFTLCNNKCIDLTKDVKNCGQCGATCTAPDSNSIATCTAGQCGCECKSGFTFCNKMCVDVTNDLNNCGSCGTVCPGQSPLTGGVTAGYSICASSSCDVVLCPALRANCDKMSSNGCEEDLTSTEHCGACGNACPLAETLDNTESVGCGLNGGICRCQITECATGFEDSDGDINNGCEAPKMIK